MYNSSYTLPDALYFFNGDWLEYDAIGNPTEYFNYTGNYSFFYFTWTGRELTSATRGNDSYTFEYNENGLRSSKVKNGVETKYYYDGDLLLMEVRGRR